MVERVHINRISFSLEDIRQAVSLFYSRVQDDLVLKEPFRSVEDWPNHIERLTHFWWTRFGGQPYLNVEYNPVEKHVVAGFDAGLLSRWLVLFELTLREVLAPEQAEIWILVAHKMGQSLSIQNELYKSKV